MTVGFYTFGCKVNQYETNCIKELMANGGYTITDNILSAGIAVINTCTVTESADIKLGQLIRRIKRRSPESVIVIAGCYPQAHGTTELISEADIIVGEANKTDIPALVNEYVSNNERVVLIPEHGKGECFESMSISQSQGKTRAIIKIQDGCDRYCSYCVIPYARGRSRSKPLSDIEREACELGRNGHKELVLVGINLSCYGMDLDSTDLADAVHTAAKSDAQRIRLGSIEPEVLTEDIIKRLSSEEKLCPHFHLSLQSGCDETLKRMRRKYTSREYKELVDMLRRYFPDCAVTTDVMVGFAGETDEEFESSLAFVKSIGFSKVHVFPYSEREGTLGAKMERAVPKQVRFKRAEIMAKASELSEAEFLETRIGKTVSVLFERERDSEFHRGHTEDYLMVKVPKMCDTLRGEIKNVRILSRDGDCLVGEIV